MNDIESKNILKVAKLLKKNQWVTVIGKDFDFNHKCKQQNNIKPKGTYFSKGEWLYSSHLFEDTGEFNCINLAVVEINDENILVLKSLNDMLDFTEEYGFKMKLTRKHVNYKTYVDRTEESEFKFVLNKRRDVKYQTYIDWNEVSKDYDGIILYQQAQYFDYEGSVKEKFDSILWATLYDVTTLVLFNSSPIKTIHMIDCENGDFTTVYKKLRKIKRMMV